MFKSNSIINKIISVLFLIGFTLISISNFEYILYRLIINYFNNCKIFKYTAN